MSFNKLRKLFINLTCLPLFIYGSWSYGQAISDACQSGDGVGASATITLLNDVDVSCVTFQAGAAVLNSETGDARNDNDGVQRTTIRHNSDTGTSTGNDSSWTNYVGMRLIFSRPVAPAAAFSAWDIEGHRGGETGGEILSVFCVEY